MSFLKKENIYSILKVYFCDNLEFKRWVWFGYDFKETVEKVHRQSYKNSAEDFKDSELILQDFIRRYTDETSELPLTADNARIGPLGMGL